MICSQTDGGQGVGEIGLYLRTMSGNIDLMILTPVLLLAAVLFQLGKLSRMALIGWLASNLTQIRLKQRKY